MDADGDLPKVDREFIALSIERGRKAQARARRVRALFYVLLGGITGSLLGIIEKEAIKEQLNWFTVMRDERSKQWDWWNEAAKFVDNSSGSQRG